MSDDATRHDIEHYIRIADSIIAESAEFAGRSLVNPEGERPGATEAELVETFLDDARRLSHSYVRLLSWLQQSGNRKAGVTGGKRGNERMPRRPRM